MEAVLSVPAMPDTEGFECVEYVGYLGAAVGLLLLSGRKLLGGGGKLLCCCCNYWNGSLRRVVALAG
jgi:hypothetical protein